MLEIHAKIIKHYPTTAAHKGLVSTQHEKDCSSDVVASVFIMISTSIAEELRILHFHNLFQL
jgi:hypothetical protein